MLTHARTIRPRTHAKYIIILAILLNRLYKNKKNCILLLKYLHMSKKSSTFATDFKNNMLNN